MFKQGIRDALKSVFRNFSLSIASIFCIVITLLLVSISVLLSVNLSNITNQIEKNLTIVVFMNKEATTIEVESLESKLKSLNNVASIEFESKEEIKQKMSKESPTFKSVMDTWTEETNPLKHTFLIKVLDGSSINSTSEQIKGMPEVSTTQYGEGMVEDLIDMFAVIEKITIAVVVGMV